MSGRYDLLQLIDRIYEAAADPRAWPDTIAAIADALGAHTTSLNVIGTAPGALSLLVAPRTDPEWLRVFAARWAARNVIRERGLSFPVGAVYRFNDLMPRSSFERTEFYNEFWRPQHQEYGIFSNLANGKDAVAGIGFYRSGQRGVFDAEAEATLRLLTPHLRRAVLLNLRIGRAESERDATVEALDRFGCGALLVDAEGRILYANAAGEAVLREAAGLRSVGGRLRATLPPQTAALRAMIGGSGTSTGPGGELAVTCGDGRTLAVAVLPTRARDWETGRPGAAIVLVREPSRIGLPSADSIGRMFGLTGAQAALAREILLGDGVDAAAKRLGVGRATARTHLAEVFQRTGTRRQAELVRVILQHLLPFREIS